MKAAAFEYHVPESLDEAVSLLAELGDGAKVIAGGQSLVPLMALRLATFEHLVDIWHLDALRGVERRNGSVRVGASTPDVHIERDADVLAAAPLLSKVTPLIGHVQIRNRGTIGGSIAHADPAAEYPATAVALDASIEMQSSRGIRTVPAGEFFEGVWTTAVEPDEIVTAVDFPAWQGRCGFAVEEFARRHGDFAVAGALVGVELAEDDRIARASITVFGVGPAAVRASKVESMLVGGSAADHDADEIGREAVATIDEPFGDLHAPAVFRVRVGQAMVARAWTSAVEEARHG